MTLNPKKGRKTVNPNMEPSMKKHNIDIIQDVSNESMMSGSSYAQQSSSSSGTSDYDVTNNTNGMFGQLNTSRQSLGELM
jgi:hypothetical protein